MKNYLLIDLALTEDFYMPKMVSNLLFTLGYVEILSKSSNKNATKIIHKTHCKITTSTKL